MQSIQLIVEVIVVGILLIVIFSIYFNMSYRIEKNGENKDIVIDGWENGIADSPFTGIPDMRGIDPSSVLGEASVALKTTAMYTQAPITNATVTADHPTDTFTYDGVIPLEVNTAIKFTNTGGALPTGLSVDTAYYIKTIPTSTTFTISEVSAGGTVLNITGSGSGTNTFSTIQMGTPKCLKSLNIVSQVGLDMFYYFILDSNKRIWIYDSTAPGLESSNKWVYMHNQPSESIYPTGFIEFEGYKNHLFLFSYSYVNVIRLLDTSTALPSLAYLTTKNSWVTSWKQITHLGTVSSSINSRYSLVGQDDKLYFCNNNYIGSIGTTTDATESDYMGKFSLAETHSASDGVTTNGSSTITTATNFFQNTDVGAIIVGTGIPSGTTIASVTNSKTAVLLYENATITATGVTFTITQSYSYNDLALNIPNTESSNCLAELGEDLLIGTLSEKIYPWDRISPSFKFPIFCPERRIERMVTLGTNTFIFAGNRGNIYITNGTNVDNYKKIPDHLSNTINPYFTWKNAIGIRNKLYFGLSVTNNAGTTINEYGGLWEIDIKTGSLVLKNKLSYGTYSGYVFALTENKMRYPYGASSADGYGLYIGWYSGSVGGVDIGSSLPYSGGESYIDTDMIPIGQFIEKTTPTNLEFKLSTPLVTGESVAIYYRDNITEAYTLVPITQGGGVGDLSGIAIPNFENLEWIQLRAVLTSTATSPSYVRLREIRIRL